MADGAFDFAICGSSPFAGLLAGLLATIHGKRTCLIGDPWSPYRLVRNIDLSVMPATRPETWAMLKRGGTETVKLLASIGRGLTDRVDPLFVADFPVTTDYLDHMRWVALGLGFAAERAVDRSITVEGSICRIRDATMLLAGKAEPAIEAWLQKCEVRRLSAADATITARRDSTLAIEVGDQTFDAQTVILADDEAIVALLPTAERHRLLTTSPRLSVLSETVAKPLAAPLITYIDRALTLHQRGGKGPITAIAGREADVALPAIGASVAGIGPVRRAGQARLLSVGTTDGALLIGRMGKAKATVIAGLGSSAAFLAPLVARHIAGTGSDDEKAYFAAREVAKAGNRGSVAELAVQPAIEIAS